MPTRKAEATWEGDLKGGKGRMKVGSGAFEGAFSFSTRFQDEPGTNPEELVGAAHAGCFSMAFSNMLAGEGHPPQSVHTRARVHLETTDDGPAITRIELVTRGRVPGISEQDFLRLAEAAKKGCPVSKALAGPEITLEATLET